MGLADAIQRQQSIPEILTRLRKVAIVPGVSDMFAEYAKEFFMAVAIVLAGRWAFLHPDRALLLTNARDAAPTKFSLTLIRGAALLVLLAGSWVLCSLVLRYSLSGLLHQHPAAFRASRNLSAILLAAASVFITKKTKTNAATAASR